MAKPSEPSARTVLDLALSRPPTLGGARLICVDGPSGSGKTTFAAAVTTLWPGAVVIHTDDLLDGWEGLPDLESQLDGLLSPMVDGRPGHYRRHDWHLGEYAETVTVEPAPLLILDGVGSGSLGVAELVTVLIWVEAARDVRRGRGIERDGEAFAPYWESWEVAERQHFARHQTRERADLTLST